VLPNGRRIWLKDVLQWQADRVDGRHDFTGKWPGWRVRQQWLIAPGGAIRRGRISEHVRHHVMQMNEWTGRNDAATTATALTDRLIRQPTRATHWVTHGAQLRVARAAHPDDNTTNALHVRRQRPGLPVRQTPSLPPTTRLVRLLPLLSLKLRWPLRHPIDRLSGFTHITRTVKLAIPNERHNQQHRSSENRHGYLRSCIHALPPFHRAKAYSQRPLISCLPLRLTMAEEDRSITKAGGRGGGDLPQQTGEGHGPKSRTLRTYI
jgi:hypothetical protein